MLLKEINPDTGVVYSINLVGLNFTYSKDTTESTASWTYNTVLENTANITIFVSQNSACMHEIDSELIWQDT